MLISNSDTLQEAVQSTSHLVLQQALESGNLRFGFPMWSKKTWYDSWLPKPVAGEHVLAPYSHMLGSVEGNTTFYAIPDEQTLATWFSASTDDFRFVMKLPKAVSHGRASLAENLRQHQADVVRLQRSLGHKLGLLFLQCPDWIGPSQLGQLKQILDGLKQLLPDQAVSMEVRHPQFFDRADHEQALLRLLSDYDVGRTIFDSRGLFADRSQSFDIKDAQQKKPRLPVHPTATARVQMVRLIGHSVFSENHVYWQQWRKKISQWLIEGRQVYFFLHTAGNDNVYECYQALCQHWQIRPVISEYGGQPSLW